MMQEYLLSFDPPENEWIIFTQKDYEAMEERWTDFVLATDRLVLGSSGIYTPQYIMRDSLRPIIYETLDPFKD